MLGFEVFCPNSSTLDNDIFLHLFVVVLESALEMKQFYIEFSVTICGYTKQH